MKIRFILVDFKEELHSVKWNSTKTFIGNNAEAFDFFCIIFADILFVGK